MKPYIANLIAVVLLSAASSAVASWADIPLEARMLTADLIVVGKITDVVPAGDRHGRAHAHGIIAVKQLIRVANGGPEMELPQTVKLLFPDPKPKAKNGVLTMTTASTDITYKKGQSGVWILTATDAPREYTCTYPGNHQGDPRVDAIKAVAQSLRKLQWGKPVDGVSTLFAVRSQRVSTTTDPTKLVDDNLTLFTGEVTLPPTFYLRVFVRNMSDKPLTLCSYVGDRPVKLVAGPPPGGKGEAAAIDLYEWLKRARIMPLRKEDFFTLRPGQVRELLFYQVNLSAGVHTLQATYHQPNDGKAFKLENVWTGQAPASLLTATIEQPKGDEGD